MMEKEKPPNKNIKAKHRWYIRVILTVFVVVITLGYQWLTEGTVDKTQAIALMVMAVVILLFLEFRKIFRPLLTIIGEEPGIQRSPPRFFIQFIIILFFTVPFVFYVLLHGTQETGSSALDFNIIIIAPTLGGLIFAGAANRRINNITRIELISVVKKLIVATVLFILFKSLFFTVELTGGIDTNIPDWSSIGIFRGVSFWASAVFFYIGIFLFLFGITDLVLALRHIRK